MKIKQKLRDVRTEQGFSQEALAELVNVSRQTISKWENGAAYPSGENLTALSRVFGLPVEALINDDWTPPEEPEPAVVEVPVPVPNPIRYRLWAVLIALVVTVGIAVGILYFRDRPEEFVPMAEIGGEIVSVTPGENIPFLSPDDSNS